METPSPGSDRRKWVEGRRKAAERELLEMRFEGPSPETSIRRGLALIAFYAELHGWPVREDPITRRENESVRETWKRLRAPYVVR